MSPTPTWEELLAENQRHVIGDLWLSLVLKAVRNTTPRYPASLYSETGEWNEHERQNLVQAVVLEQLLEQGQLAYILATATTVDSATALLHHLVRRTLGHSRRRTVVDNLLDRCRALRTMPPASGPGAASDDVAAAARAVAAVPRLKVHSDERAPVIYTAQALELILEITQTHLGPDFSERDLSRILEHVLTSFLPSSLVQGDGRPPDTVPDLSPDQEAEVADVLSNLLSAMSVEQRTIVALKLANHSDNDVARHLGMSRPTAAKRFREATSLIEASLLDLAVHLQNTVLTRLSTELERYAPPAPDVPSPS